MTKEVIPIHKHYLIIDSPIPFTLIANDGVDEVYRMSGAWQIDMWKLLTKEDFKQYPVYKIEISYDETKLEEGQKITYKQSDINLGTGVSGVNGQLVNVTNFPIIQTTLNKHSFLEKNNINSWNNFYNYLINFFKDFYNCENTSYIFNAENLNFYIDITLTDKTDIIICNELIYINNSLFSDKLLHIKITDSMLIIIYKDSSNLINYYNIDSDYFRYSSINIYN